MQEKDIASAIRNGRTRWVGLWSSREASRADTVRGASASPPLACLHT